MSNLSRLAFLGMAPESAAGTYVPPTVTIPFNKATYETVKAPLRDESVRANDAVLQGLYSGPENSTWDIDVNGYPDLLGHFLRIVGPDTVTAGVSTTLSADTVVGATSISTAVSIPAGTTIKIGTGAAVEYAITGAPSGAGPYTIPITSPATGGLLKPHTSGDAVVGQTTHTFQQSTTQRPPSWSLSVWDTVDYRGWPGCVLSELQLKIDPKGAISAAPKFVGFPEQVVASFVPAYVQVEPVLGWQWTMKNAGASSTRGLTLDLTFKRATEPIHSSDGVAAPREVFCGALELDASYKAIYENTTDYDLFLTSTQTETTATLTKPYSKGGESVAFTMSQSGYHKGQRDLGQTYVQASFDLSAIANTTDGGIVQVVLKNWQTAAY